MLLQIKRVGRGIGSGLGKTSGRGHKGQKARSGSYTGSRSHSRVSYAPTASLPAWGLVSCLLLGAAGGQVSYSGCGNLQAGPAPSSQGTADPAALSTHTLCNGVQRAGSKQPRA